MFELGTTDHWWEMAKKFPVLSNHPNILKPLGYAHMVNLVETFKPKRILEVGHGSGTYFFQLFKNRKDVEIWGLDDEVKDSSVSVDDLNAVREWNPHVKFVTGLLGTNVQELPENYFDLVFSVSVIEHIPHEFLPGVFEETKRILKPGGIVSHSYDVYYGQDSSAVYNAYKSVGLQWLKKENTMNVFWEPWLRKVEYDELVELCEKVVMENPVFVAEHYMWQQERQNRQAPMNYLTIVNAAKKPDGAVEPYERDPNEIVDEFKAKDLTDIFLPENFNYFTYSKKYHFDIFKESGTDKLLFKNGVDPQYSDINSYQDLLVLSFIKKNIPAGSRILEIGGNGFSRLIPFLKSDYEVWNIEKLNEAALSKTDTNGYKYVNAKIEDPDNTLPDNYFDFVYSISAFRHENVTGNDGNEKILREINRILKPGGFSLQTTIAMLKENSMFLPNIMYHFFKNEKTINHEVLQLKLITDENIFHMSEKFYTDNWEKFTRKNFRKFGLPVSYNVLWKKQ